MIPIVREFFRGLRERDELDAIIPELLTAMGFEVLSRPMIGTRQYGSDVAAIGRDEDGIRKLFLFAIKKGDLNRQEWNGSSDQALRPSLDDIRDAYLRTVAPAHRKLPVVICATLGGVVLENVQQSLNGYFESAETDRIKFRVWTGDTLTTMIVNGALREEVFPTELRNLLRKAAALVEEPDASLRHFSELIDRVIEDTSQDEVGRVRILYLALWILAIWGRDEGNLDAPYRASEVVTLRAWDLLRDRIEADRTRKLDASHALLEVVNLHLRIWNELYGQKIIPHAGNKHALSFAVRSRRALDVNLALFDTVGRVAVGGLWRLWSQAAVNSPLGPIDKPSAELVAIAKGLADMVRANPALFTPVREDQGIDVSLALLLLLAVPSTRAEARNWLRQSVGAIRQCLSVGRWYPVITRDYSELLRHPEPAEFDGKTSGSIIQPLLALGALAAEDEELLAVLSRLQEQRLSHSNYQTWVPNDRTEAGIWRGEPWQGSSLGSLKIGEDGSALLDAIRSETKANEAYPQLSAVRLDHWPMLLLACRSVRLPPPPQLWLGLIDQLRNLDPEFGEMRATMGGRARVRRALRVSASRTALLRGLGQEG